MTTFTHHLIDMVTLHTTLDHHIMIVTVITTNYYPCIVLYSAHQCIKNQFHLVILPIAAIKMCILNKYINFTSCAYAV